MKTRNWIVAMSFPVWIACCLFARAQFTIDWFTIDGGGSTSSGGVYLLSGSTGQPDAGGALARERYWLTGGFQAFAAKPKLPEVGPISAPLDPVHAGTVITVSASFTDDQSPHTAEWDWGDGTTSSGVVDQEPSSVTGTHVYPAAGIYTVTLAVTNQAWLTGYGSFEYVVVYDPAGGFATGGGWIWSPQGALHPDLAGFAEVTGKATFGFVSKYKKGAHVPTGQTEFRFRAGGLNFHSTEYQWLVIAGARAQYKGAGTVNGVTGYRFMLTAIDGDQLGGSQPDRFRIKIREEATGEMVYDNQVGTDDNSGLSTNGTLVQGGSIVVHKK